MITIIGVTTSTPIAPGTFVRSRVHPVCADLRDVLAFDHLLDTPNAAQLIGDTLLAQSGDITYAVPGHPLWGDATVRYLLQQAPTQCQIVAPDSDFITPLYARIGEYPQTAGVQCCDALDFVPVPDARVSWASTHTTRPYAMPVYPLPVQPSSAAWIFHVHSAHLLAQVVLQLQQQYAPTQRVAVLAAHTTSWHTFVDVVAQTHTFPVTLYLPAVAPLADQRSPAGIAYVIMRLLGPGGCPWDHEQTPQSLRRTLLEETYEAIDALDRGDDASLLEELGDVLLNILMQAEMARQADRFTMADIYQQVTAKFIRRHPHVFGDMQAADSEAVLQNWYRIKQSEAGADTPKSPLAGVPLALPALTATMALLNKSKRYGMRMSDIPTTPPTAEELGAQLFALATTAMAHDMDAEAALREINARYRARVDALFARDGHLNDQNQHLWRDQPASDAL
jgi:tetrapyrrole methylase family protein/MazG family protein